VNKLYKETIISHHDTKRPVFKKQVNLKSVGERTDYHQFVPVKDFQSSNRLTNSRCLSALLNPVSGKETFTDGTSDNKHIQKPNKKTTLF
jgi:hypothetical protein